MKKYLFSSNTVLALIVAGALAAVPAASASAATSSSTVFATLQGTSVLGQEVPVLGTRGWYVTLPIGSHVVPGEELVWEAIDFTVTSTVTVGNTQVAYLYVDPKMAR